MKFSSFDAHAFRHQVDESLKRVKTILDVNRNPRYAEDEEHSYSDKFALAEMLINTAISAQVNTLQRIGMTEDKLRQIRNMVVEDKRAVTLRLELYDTCEFLREQDVKVVHSQGGVEFETTTVKSGILGGTRKTKDTLKHKITSMVKEFHWKIGVHYRILCYSGNDPARNAIELQSRSSSEVVVTTGSNKAPFLSKTTHSPIQCSLTWLLQHISAGATGGADDKKDGRDGLLSCSFKIDRDDAECRTPRRNRNVEAAMVFFQEFSHWATLCARAFTGRLQDRLLGAHSPAKHDGAIEKTLPLERIDAEQVFIPIVPLFDMFQEDLPGTVSRQESPSFLAMVPTPSTPPLGTDNAVGLTMGSPLLSVGDLGKFLNEHCRSMDDTTRNLGKTYPNEQTGKIITVREAKLWLMFRCMNKLSGAVEQSIGYLEEMLRKQFIAAIGKEVTPQDFDGFMAFHSRKLFSPEYAPKPFCFAIGRPNHYPDGMLTIEKKPSSPTSGSGSSDSSATPEPINTMVRKLRNNTGVSIPLSVAATMQMCGPMYVHGWMLHRFESSSSPDYVLAARARQFSSFVLMAGTMAGPDEFTPKDAIIVQNKDEVLIPLLLEEIPSAKEFKDAIASLSPEQQRFAKAFRAMQLESSVFGLCVVQLKPQLEALLGLPDDALTKEIRLTQDLMSLFMDYQIPSDLLSFDGPQDADRATKLSSVKENVSAVLQVVAEAKKEQLHDGVQGQAMRKASSPTGSRYTDDDSSDEEDEAMELFCASAMDTDGLVASSTFGSLPTKQKKKPRSSAVPRRMMAMKLAGAAAPPPAAGGRGGFLRGGGGAPPGRSAGAPAATPQPEAPTDAPTDARDVAHLSEGTIVNTTDVTSLPKQLDAKFELYDKQGALRSTAVKTSNNWKRTRLANLLSKPQASDLDDDTIRAEKNKAFDLLDALSRSGTLPIACGELHVVIATTHRFENDIMGTVIQDNINPIEKVEKSALMIASTIHGNVPTTALLKQEEDVERLEGLFPEVMAITDGN